LHRRIRDEDLMETGEKGYPLDAWYQVSDFYMRSDAFGNFAAAYAATRVWGGLGYIAVRIGGISFANDEDPWTGEIEDPLDRPSLPAIKLGRDWGLKD